MPGAGSGIWELLGFWAVKGLGMKEDWEAWVLGRQRSIGCGGARDTSGRERPERNTTRKKVMGKKRFSRRSLVPGIGGICAILLMSVSVASGGDIEDYAFKPEHLQWLEEVSYIISKREREAFVALTNSKDRDLFIKIFWKARDPTPGSVKNEYREAHYERLKHANEFLGRDTTREGWKTDRGRVYILLGKPRSISRISGQLGLVESELWYYDNVTIRGVPPFLYILFFKPNLGRPFELYTPGTHKPTDLLAGNFKMSTEADAYSYLRETDPELAAASLSMEPGQGSSRLPGSARSSFDTMVMGRIETSPTRFVDTGYVDRLHFGEGAIDLEYTFDYTKMSVVAREFFHPGAGLVLDVALEIQPKDLTLVRYEEEVYTTLSLFGELQDSKERQISKIDEDAEVHLKLDQVEAIRFRPLNLHSRTVARPGAYDLNLLLKSQAAKQYSRAELKVWSDDPEGVKAWMSLPLPCYRVEPESKVTEGKEKAFQFGPFRVYPKVSGAFRPSDEVIIYVQLYRKGISYKKMRRHQVRFRVVNRSGATIFSKDVDLAESAQDREGRAHVVFRVGAGVLPLGSVDVVATLVAPGGEELVTRRVALEIRSDVSGAVPWLLSRSRPGPGSAQSLLERARSSLAGGDPGNAVTLLRGVAASQPSALELLIRAYFQLGQPAHVVELLGAKVAPLLYSQARLTLRQSLWYEALMDAHWRLGEWAKALPYLERLAGEQEYRPELLFRLAEVYGHLGKNRQARKVLERACKSASGREECRDLAKKKVP